MKNFPIAACAHDASLLLLPLALLCSCSQGGDDEPEPPGISNPTVVALADCTALGIREANDIAEGVLDLIDAIDDPAMPPVGVTYDPMTGVFDVVLDLDRDGIPDTTIDGRIQPPLAPLADGFQQSEAFAFDWTAAGAFDGSGALTITHQGTSIRFEGAWSLADAAGDSFDVTDLNTSLFETPEGIEANGILRFDVAKANDTMTGVASFVPGDDALVTAMSAGERVTFYVDLESFTAYVE